MHRGIVTRPAITAGIMMVDCACPPRCHTQPAPSLSDRIVDTMDLLSRYHILSSDEFLTLSMNLNTIASYLDETADRQERGAVGDEYV
jgi:hypothetical protein